MRLLILALVAGAIGVPMLLIASAFAATETTVADVPIEDGGIQRVLLVSTPSPKAALIMCRAAMAWSISALMAIPPDGWKFSAAHAAVVAGAGFCRCFLTPPNGMSLLG